jgi:Fe-S cluster assembly ATPase SufC
MRLLGKKVPIIKFKEKDIDNWIGLPNISSGMLKTLMHIAELYLLPDDSVVLIDEFENSLGVNCLDEVTANILNQESGKQQFIITSHHPYVINNIDPEYWKLVTRKGNVVQVRDSSEFDLGASKHSAFTKLMNLDEYEGGIQG